MILWITALLLLAVLGLVGYYQGALRVAISTVGLLLAALLMVPLAGVFKFILPVVGVSHPALVPVFAPVCMFILLLIVFKAVGIAVNKKVEWWYKNKASDTKRMLWERMNSRVGIALGVLNGAIYLVLICVLVYVLGYFTVPMASSPKDAFVFKVINSFANGMQETKMDKAVAGFVPAKPFYYDSIDVLSMIFHTPLLQGRLSGYPPFLTLSERPEFKELGQDLKFQEFWQSGPSLAEFRENEKVAGLANNVDLYNNIVNLLEGDAKDLKEYLATGQSPKYAEEKILGRWKIEYGASFAAAKKAKPNMTRIEQAALTRAFVVFKDAELVATVDKNVTFKVNPPGGSKTYKGTWSGSGNNYTLSVSEGGKTDEIAVTVNDSKLVAKKDAFNLNFRKD